MKKRICFEIAALTFALVAAAQGSVYWVATDGDDAAAGTEASPFATLPRALEAAADGDTVKVRPGAYSVPLTASSETPWAKILSAVTVEASDLASMPEFNGGGRNVLPLWLENEGARVRGLKFTNFKSNTTWNKYLAGMVHIKAGTLDSCVLSDSTCNYSGIVTMNGGVVTNCTFRNLSSTDSNSWGTGALLYSGTPLVVDSLFDSCKARQGAGIYMQAAGTVRNCRIVNCVGEATSRGYGGALVMTAGLVENCIIATNTVNVGTSASYPGTGGVQIRGGTLRNCLIAGNRTCGGITGNSAGGLFLAAGAVESCTVTGNCNESPDRPGQGAYQKNGSLLNSIVFENSAMSLSDDVNNFVREGGRVSYSCVYPATEGEGNIAVNPLFDAQAPYGVLSGGSACIDAGTNQVWMTDARDVYGNSRLYGIADIGCYEVDLSKIPFSAMFTIGGSVGVSPFSVDFSGVVVAAPGNIQSNVWDFGDGTIISGPLNISHTYTSYGKFSVRLSVYAEGAQEPAVYEIADAVEVGTGKTYVAVDGGNVWPYATPETAARNILDAVGALSFASATSVAEVEVAPGRYYVGETASKDTPWINLTRPVRIYSSGGPDVTFVDGGWSGTGSSPVRYAFYLNNSLCSLEGFTIEKIYSNVNYGLKESGAVHLALGTVSNCVIRNSSFFFEGPLSIVGGTAVDCVVSNNVCRDGWTSGGVAIWGAGKLLNSLVADNRGKDGPGLYLSHAGGVVSNCVFRGNICEMTTRGSFGAVVITAGLVTHSEITDNTGYYGAVSVSNSGKLRNSLVVRNKCVSGTHSGGGILIAGGTVESCTVAGNVSTLVTPGHGIRQTGGTVRNSIIACNGSGVFLDDNNISKTGGTMEYTCVYPAVAGTGNISSDPMFSSAATGDYTLSLSSPCRDAGLAQDWMEGAGDLYGNARLIGEGPELGVAEIDPAKIPFSCDISVRFQPSGIIPLTVAFSGLAFSAPGEIDSYVWDFGDGATASGAEVTHTYTEAGKYSVRLTVRSGDAAVEKILADAVTAGFSEAYVSPDGESVWPYSTERTAATNLQDAIDAVMIPASGNARVNVRPGVYALETRSGDKNFALLPQITIVRPVDVVSTDGPEATVIDGGGVYNAFSRGIVMSNPKASFRGFTVRGVRSAIDDKASSGAVEMTGGTLADCIITNNSGTWSAPVGVKGGVVENCFFADNSSSDSAAEGGAVRIAGTALVTGCEFRRNKSVYGAAMWVNAAGAVVSNCVVASNSGLATGRGFGGAAVELVSGTVTHCAITDNTGFAAGGVTTWNDYSGVKNASPLLRNCLIARNGAKYYGNELYGAGGVFHGAGTVESCTITANSRLSGARAECVGGILARRASGASGSLYELVNTILWGNDTEDELSAALSIENCLMADPLFKNCEKGDYRLSPASAGAINRGVNRPWMGGTSDLAGNRRITGGTVDIGCYEFRTSATLLQLR